MYCVNMYCCVPKVAPPEADKIQVEVCSTDIGAYLKSLCRRREKTNKQKLRQQLSLCT